MKIFTKTIFKLSTIALATLIFAFIGSSCEQGDTDSPNTPLYAGDDNSFFFNSKLSATHKIGTSPCPQDIGSTNVFCSRTGDSCTADSAVITNPYPGLNAKFSNGAQSSGLGTEPNNPITKFFVEFNCNVPMSFMHTYKVAFYKNGIKVDEQDFEVNMTVEQ